MSGSVLLRNILAVDGLSNSRPSLEGRKPTGWMGMLCTLLIAMTLAWQTPAKALDSDTETTQHRSLVDASKYPWSAVGRVNIAGVRARSHCTGALVGFRVVITAAHCLYRADLKKWATPGVVHFVAGYQRGEYEAHSTASELIISPGFDPLKWAHPDNYPNDWAVIILKQPIGLKVGYLGVLAMTPQQLKTFKSQDRRFALTGYPRDRAHAISVDVDCTLDEFFTDAHLVSHHCKIVNGDSGAPISLLFSGGLAVVAVNSASGIDTSRGKTNTAVPIAAFADRVINAIRKTEQAPSFGKGPVRAGRLPGSREN